MSHRRRGGILVSDRGSTPIVPHQPLLGAVRHRTVKTPGGCSATARDGGRSCATSAGPRRKEWLTQDSEALRRCDPELFSIWTPLCPLEDLDRIDRECCTTMPEVLAARGEMGNVWEDVWEATRVSTNGSWSDSKLSRSEQRGEPEATPASLRPFPNATGRLRALTPRPQTLRAPRRPRRSCEMPWRKVLTLPTAPGHTALFRQVRAEEDGWLFWGWVWA